MKNIFFTTLTHSLLPSTYIIKKKKNFRLKKNRNRGPVVSGSGWPLKTENFSRGWGVEIQLMSLGDVENGL